jgi:hypothetical protein
VFRDKENTLEDILMNVAHYSNLLMIRENNGQMGSVRKFVVCFRTTRFWQNSGDLKLAKLENLGEPQFGNLDG